MAALNDIKRKISAIKQTKQITRAMNMVAGAKLRSVQGRMEQFKPYAAKFKSVLSNLTSHITEENTHPLFVNRSEVKKIELLIFTADRGLCGSFNLSIITFAEKWMREREHIDFFLNIVGKKGIEYFSKKSIPISESHVQVYGSADIAYVNKLTGNFINRFNSGEVDEVYMIFSEFRSISQQKPAIVQLLPITPPEIEEEEVENKDYIYEPDPQSLLIELLPKHISVQIMNAFLQNETSENAARMIAMDNATRNCSELVDSLTLIFNKARQAAITSELIDIVGGAEAL